MSKPLIKTKALLILAFGMLLSVSAHAGIPEVCFSKKLRTEVAVSFDSEKRNQILSEYMKLEKCVHVAETSYGFDFALKITGVYGKMEEGCSSEDVDLLLQKIKGYGILVETQNSTLIESCRERDPWLDGTGGDLGWMYPLD